MTEIPEDAIVEEKFLAASGPGGQNVNKVATAVQLRVDVFIRRQGAPEEQLADGLRRARLYLEAGADCVYPIILTDEAMIAEFVQAVGIVNVTMRRGGPLSLERVASLGVRRVSYATSVFREAAAAVEHIVGAIHDEATGLTR